MHQTWYLQIFTNTLNTQITPLPTQKELQSLYDLREREREIHEQVYVTFQMKFCPFSVAQNTKH